MPMIKYSTINPKPIKFISKPNPNYIPPLQFEQSARAQINTLYTFQSIQSLAQKFTRNTILFDLNNLTPSQFITKYNPPLI